MATRLRILLIASEVAPFAKTGGLADVAGALPRALAALGHDVRILLPSTAARRPRGRPGSGAEHPGPAGRSEAEGTLLEGRARRV